MSDICDYPCLICQKIVKNYDPKMCCSGRECGCLGQPTEPCVCGQECWNGLMDGAGTPLEERRVKARIEIFKEEQTDEA